MNERRWMVRLAAALVAVSTLLYLARWLIFGQGEEMLRYLVDDLAFIPIQVALVTLVLDALLARRERDALLNKLNMVVGAFYSEVGTPLLERLKEFDTASERLCDPLGFRSGWGPKEFARARALLASCDLAVDSRSADLASLRDFLHSKRTFMLALLQNPNLLEHASFTELLWAVLHLGEELDSRRSLEGLPASDLVHLTGDIGRAYGALLRQWAEYMQHLSTAYPYLYSLAVRQNPFDPRAEVEVSA